MAALDNTCQLLPVFDATAGWATRKARAGRVTWFKRAAWQNRPKSAWPRRQL